MQKENTGVPLFAIKRAKVRTPAETVTREVDSGVPFVRHSTLMSRQNELPVEGQATEEPLDKCDNVENHSQAIRQQMTSG